MIDRASNCIKSAFVGNRSEASPACQPATIQSCKKLVVDLRVPKGGVRAIVLTTQRCPEPSGDTAARVREAIINIMAKRMFSKAVRQAS